MSQQAQPLLSSDDEHILVWGEPSAVEDIRHKVLTDEELVDILRQSVADSSDAQVAIFIEKAGEDMKRCDDILQKLEGVRTYFLRYEGTADAGRWKEIYLQEVAEPSRYVEQQFSLHSEEEIVGLAHMNIQNRRQLMSMADVYSLVLKERRASSANAVREHTRKQQSLLHSFRYAYASYSDQQLAELAEYMISKSQLFEEEIAALHAMLDYRAKFYSEADTGLWLRMYEESECVHLDCLALAQSNQRIEDEALARISELEGVLPSKIVPECILLLLQERQKERVKLTITADADGVSPAPQASHSSAKENT